ncbi:hypothetical protein GYM75_09915 [Gilliamella sp. ESL0441]|uniref:DUF7688 family protein n=1 Tax=Gilliamella sp. ESL0441 TaxID=2704654 RepID=UPI001C6950A4|nr:hypothetical protein [Gilliamella sp. ESL0441]QYN45137.1 hypothetical protein GYM75_09915 [Gilliamella sp. ESL0441]
MLNTLNHKQEIRQFGKFVISSDNDDTEKLFNLLTGESFDSDIKYQEYLITMMKSSVFKYGEIELWINDKLISKGVISKELIKNN